MWAKLCQNTPLVNFSSLFYSLLQYYKEEAVVVVIVWWLDLQLPTQSVPITTNVVASDPTQSIQHYVIKFVSNLLCNRPVIFYGYSAFLHQ